MSTHTPGPWLATVTNSPPKREFIVEAGGADICRYLKYDDYPRHSAARDEVEANARLIAASPDLLHALEVLLEEADNFSVQGVSFSEKCMGHRGPALAQAAIAKARGG